MYLLACGAILATGLVLNVGDRRMLALTAMVGVGVFLPVPSESAFQFYASCIAIELMVGVVAFALRAPASLLVIEVCALLVAAHTMGYALDGHPPFSPYRVIVKLLEVSMLAVCVALSPIVAPILRNHDAKTT